MIRIVPFDQVMLFEPKSDAARRWLEVNVDGVWWAGALVVEPKHTLRLAENAREAGFEVEQEGS